MSMASGPVPAEALTVRVDVGFAKSTDSLNVESIRDMPAAAPGSSDMVMVSAPPVKATVPSWALVKLCVTVSKVAFWRISWSPGSPPPLKKIGIVNAPSTVNESLPAPPSPWICFTPTYVWGRIPNALTVTVSEPSGWVDTWCTVKLSLPSLISPPTRAAALGPMLSTKSPFVRVARNGIPLFRPTVTGVSSSIVCPPKSALYS